MIHDVAQFQHDILGRDFPLKPQKLVGEKLLHTLTCLNEEVGELGEADTIADQADALVDTIYFALGALYQMGVDTRRVFDAVHQANMAKVPGFTKRNIPGDATKPAGWTAPNHDWLDEAAAA